MNNKTSIVTLIVVAIIAISVPFLGKAPVVNVSPTPVTVNVPEQKTPIVNVGAPVVNVPKQSPTVFGAGTGPETYVQSFFNAGLTQGGYSATTSSATAYRTDARDFAGTPSTVAWRSNVTAITLTLSATSTFGYVPKVGDVSTIYFLNATTTDAATITFAAADSGLDLQFAEATGGDLVLNGKDWAKITFIRRSATNVAVIFDEFTEAD